MPNILRHGALICATTLALAAPAAAEIKLLAPASTSSPTVGLGVSIAYGGGKAETGIGVRVFSSDRRDKTAASVGLDYMLGSKRWRGTVGVARLGKNAYLGLDLGLGLTDGAIDFGASTGAVHTRAPQPVPFAF
jgi:hypothetical protein